MGDCGAKRSFSLSPGFNVNEAAALDVCTGGEDEDGEGSAAMLLQSHSHDSFTAGGKKIKIKKSTPAKRSRKVDDRLSSRISPSFPFTLPLSLHFIYFLSFPRLGTLWQEVGEEKRREAQNGVKQQLCNFLAFAKAAAAHPIRPARRIRPTRPSLENIASKRQHTSALLKLRDPSMQ